MEEKRVRENPPKSFSRIRLYSNPMKFPIGVCNIPISAKFADTLPSFRHDLMSDKGKYHPEHLNA